MRKLTGLLVALFLAGCATAPPPLTPWRADALLPALPADCADSAAPAPDAAVSGGVPGGLAVVRSEGRDVVLVAARSCVWTVDAVTGSTAPLPTRGDSIAPTMIDGTSSGLAFSSSLSGSVRVIDTAGAVSLNVSGLRRPLGTRLLPGGIVLVAEHGEGRILRLGPSHESRPRLIADKLDGPVGLIVVDATKGYVTEADGGRVTLFYMDHYETRTVAKGLRQPEGIALLADGRLAVAEVGARRLIAVDPEGGAIEVMADNLPVGLASPRDDADPYSVTDVAVAPGGGIFVSADLDRTVLTVTRRAAAPN